MGELVDIAFEVSGMHCASCGLLIDEALEALQGVERSETDTRRGRTVVRADLAACSVDDLVSAIVDSGYAATLEGR